MTSNRSAMNACLSLALASVALLAATTGCADAAEAPASVAEEAGVTTAWVDLPDGRSVFCVITDRYVGSGESGIDCDWAGAAREGEPADD